MEEATILELQWNSTFTNRQNFYITVKNSQLLTEIYGMIMKKLHVSTVSVKHINFTVLIL
jgi:hypothetical protein